MPPFHSKNEDGYVQHLTWATKDRESFFAGEEGASICLAAIEKERERMRLEVYAYSLMPDHFHIVTDPGIFPVGTIVQWMKLASAYWLRTEGLIEGSPWAPGYWDRAIRNGDQLMTAIKYIHINPVKAELCEEVGLYPFSSCAFYETGKEGLIRITAPPV